MQKHPMTIEGAKALEQELHRLKFVERPRIIDAIASAREHGDLKENAEYHAAREQQSFVEGRIQELEAKLSLYTPLFYLESACGFGPTRKLPRFDDRKWFNIKSCNSKKTAIFKL